MKKLQIELTYDVFDNLILQGVSDTLKHLESCKDTSATEYIPVLSSNTKEEKKKLKRLTKAFKMVKLWYSENSAIELDILLEKKI